MARATAEVLSGPGTMYSAPIATVFPINPDTAPAAGWSDLGYTEDGWALVIDKNFENIEVAEEMDPIDVRKTSQVGRLRGTSAQASLEIFQESMGGGTITIAAGPPALKTYTPPASGDFTKKAALFRGNAPTVGGAARFRDIQSPVVAATGAIEAEYKKAPDKTLIGIDYQMIKTTGQSLFTIIDRTT